MKDNSHNPSLLNLFRQEALTHTEALSNGIIEWEQNGNPELIEPLMRAAHSLKGAAKIVGIDKYSKLAHALEDCFVNAQKTQSNLNEEDFDAILKAIEFLQDISELNDDELKQWPGDQANIFESILEKIAKISPLTKENASEKPEITKQEKTQEKKSPIDTIFYSEVNHLIGILKNELKSIGINKPTQSQFDNLIYTVVAIQNTSNIADKKDTEKMATQLQEFITELKFKDESIKKSETDNIYSFIDKILESVDKEVAINKKIKDSENKLSPIPFHKTIKKRNIYSTHETSGINLTKKNLIGTQDNYVRVSAAHLNLLMALSAEYLIETRRLEILKKGLLQLKTLHHQFAKIFENNFNPHSKSPQLTITDSLYKSIQLNTRSQQGIVLQQLELSEDFSRRNALLSSKLYSQVLSSRMRPFSDRTQGYPLLVRNLSRTLNKKIELKITGKETLVDRDILEKLEAPLNHIIRNACDHGIESPEQRTLNNKEEKGTIQIHARHSGGKLLVTISDDGTGINVEKLRSKVLEKKLVTPEMASTLSDDELLDFLFLPGFSTAQTVTEVSGRGVGLDVVRNVIQEIGGVVKVKSEPKKGTSIFLELPITRSVIRTLLVEIAKEPYAFPLNRINRAVKVLPEAIQSIENHEYIHHNGENIAVIPAYDILGLEKEDSSVSKSEITVVIIGEKDNRCCIAIDKILGETELAIRPLDPRLGKIPCISSASLDNDGNPVLILDIDDIYKYIEKILLGELSKGSINKKEKLKHVPKRVLVVDDSLTVRETERQILLAQGYQVDIALDGMDGWNTFRSNQYDLVITDVDMPRLNGFELVTLIKKDQKYKHVPIVIVSYKDRKEDRIKGMEVGADYYLTKSSFRDDSFINVVKELIGDA